VVYGAFEKGNRNYIGFSYLIICMQGTASIVVCVFLDVEYRECMRHLMKNLKNKFHDDIFDTEMWPAAKAYTIKKMFSPFEQD
jgi:hypothetical protein